MQRLLESIDRGANSRGSVRLNKRVFGGSLRFGSHEDIEITTKAQENKTRWLLLEKAVLCLTSESLSRFRFLRKAVNYGETEKTE